MTSAARLLAAVGCALLTLGASQYELDYGIGDFLGGAADSGGAGAGDSTGGGAPDILEAGQADWKTGDGTGDFVPGTGEGEGDFAPAEEPAEEPPAAEEPAADAGCTNADGQGCGDLPPGSPAAGGYDYYPEEEYDSEDGRGFGNAEAAPPPGGEKTKSEYAPGPRRPNEGAPVPQRALHNFIVTPAPRTYPKRFKCKPQHWFLGDSALALPYNPTFYNKRGGSVQGPIELDCADGKLCCWNNAPKPRDHYEFVHVTGTVNETSWAEVFPDSPEVPDDDFLLAHADCKPNATHTAEFVSCTLPETEGDTTIKFNYWLTKNTRLRVCTRSSLAHFTARAPLENCQDVPAPGPGPAEITMAVPKLYDIVFVGDGWKMKKGEAVAIGNVEVVYTLAPPPTVDVTTTTTTPEPTPPPPGKTTTEPAPTTTLADWQKEGTEAECAIECDFEDENEQLTWCNWEPYEKELIDKKVNFTAPDIPVPWARRFHVQDETVVVKTTLIEQVSSRINEEYTEWRTFTTLKETEAIDGLQNKAYGPFIVWGLFGNRVTGIPKARNRLTYVAAYLTTETAAPIVVYETEFIAHRIIRFYWYTATQGIRARFCCDSEAKVCPFESSPDVNVRDIGAWHPAVVVCPKGTTGLHMECTNDGGQKSQGACAIDFIRLYKWKPGIDIDHAGVYEFEPACKANMDRMAWGPLADNECGGPDSDVSCEEAAAEAEASAGLPTKDEKPEEDLLRKRARARRHAAGGSRGRRL